MTLHIILWEGRDHHVYSQKIRIYALRRFSVKKEVKETDRSEWAEIVSLNRPIGNQYLFLNKYFALERFSYSSYFLASSSQKILHVLNFFDLGLFKS
jgi:hypothetical protein